MSSNNPDEQTVLDVAHLYNSKNMIVDNIHVVDEITVDKTTTLSFLPKGIILMWNPDTSGKVPDGWTVCDGKNGTPDLRAKFIIASDDSSDTYKFQATGGEETHTLTVDEIPSHTHDPGTKFGCDGRDCGSGGASKAPGIHTDNWNFNASTTFNYLRTAPTGGDKPHDNIPPFYSLYYIMKL